MSDSQNQGNGIPWTSFLQPAVSLGLGAANYITGLITHETDKSWQEQQATTAFERQQQLLREQREYDSPLAQMRRLIDAGLNPNLAYGDLSGTGSSATAPQAAAISPANARLSADMSDLNEARLVNAQIERMQVQNANDTDMTKGQIIRWAAENNVSEQTAQKLYNDSQRILADTDRIRAEIPNIQKQFELLDEQQQELAFRNAFTKATQGLKISAENAQNQAITETAVALATAKLLNIKSETALNWARQARAKADTDLKHAQIKLTHAEIQVAAKQADLLVSQMNLNNANIKLTMQNLKQLAFYNKVVVPAPGDDSFIQNAFGAMHIMSQMFSGLVSLHN